MGKRPKEGAVSGSRGYKRLNRRLQLYWQWYCYQGIRRLENPAHFALAELADTIEDMCGGLRRPREETLVKYAARFFDTHQLPLFYKLTPFTDVYSLNTAILAEDFGKLINAPRTQLGRPRKYSADMPRHKRPGCREYDMHYHRMRRHLQDQILELFEDRQSGALVAVDEIADHVHDETEIRFSGQVIQSEIRNYNRARAPPYLDEVATCTYRLVPGNT